MADKKNSVDQLIDQYMNYLVIEKGLAAKSIEAYASDLTAFLDFLRDQKIVSIDEADTAAILKYIIELRQSGLHYRAEAERPGSSDPSPALGGHSRFLPFFDPIGTATEELRQNGGSPQKRIKAAGCAQCGRSRAIALHSASQDNQRGA
jgi:hypothetical protein